MTKPDRIVDQMARALWDYDNAARTPGWRDMAWDDMGGSEPAEERIDCEIRACALMPVVRKALAQAWDEGYEDAIDTYVEHQDDDLPFPPEHARGNPWGEDDRG